MGADILLRIVYAQDIEQFRESQLIILVHHLGDIGFIGMQPFRYIGCNFVPLISNQQFYDINGATGFGLTQCNGVHKDELVGKHGSRPLQLC